MDSSSPEGVSIIDKDESSEKAYHVVEGFVIEDSKSPFPQNGHLSFVPEDYGKEKPPPAKKLRNHTYTTPTSQNGATSSPSVPPTDDIPPGHCKCEQCELIGERESFLPPSRRFCSLTCCKRYSAEKRYYPYGRDEQGIAKSIREGLLHPRSRHLKSGSKAQNMRDQRRRKMAFYGNSGGQEQGGASGDTPTNKTPRGKGGRKPGGGARRSSQSPVQRTKRERKTSNSIVEAYVHPTGLSLLSWTVEDVGEFLTSLGYEAYVDRFVEHEIDGKALSLIKDHHLLMTLKLRLGPTLKICEHVNAIKAEEEGAEDV